MLQFWASLHFGQQPSAHLAWQTHIEDFDVPQLGVALAPQCSKSVCLHESEGGIALATRSWHSRTRTIKISLRDISLILESWSINLFYWWVSGCCLCWGRFIPKTIHKIYAESSFRFVCSTSLHRCPPSFCALGGSPSWPTRIWDLSFCC